MAIVPPHIQQFILKWIDSIGQLEALLLLRGSPGTDWDAKAVARRLYISTPDAGNILARLCGNGFLVSNGGPTASYRYRCASTDTAELVDELAEIYRLHIVPVSELIHSKSRIRIQKFADAFKLRKED